MTVDESKRMLEQPAFGRRLKALRLERNLTQAQLAEGALSVGYLSRLESGARPPTGRIVEYLAERLQVPRSAFDSEREPSSLAQVLAMASSTMEDANRAGLDDLLSEALDLEESLDLALRWQALWLLAGIRGDQSRHEDEHGLLLELQTLSDALGSAELRARVRTRLARCAQALGDNTSAREYAREAYELSKGLPVSDRAAALRILLSAEAETGQLVEARTLANELCALTEPMGGGLHAGAVWAAATVRIRLADYRGAQDVLERALHGADHTDDLEFWPRLRLAAASLYLQITPALTARGRAMLDEVAPVLAVLGTELHLQQLLTLRAQLAFQEGRVDDARALCAEIDRQELLLSFRDRLRYRMLCGLFLILDGQVDAGIKVMNKLAEQAQEALNVELAAEIWRTLAKALSDL